ncbi:MAG: ABC-ATPase domain-containing protein [Deltaproteobacteria bacterium]|nr:MAG: ABC-ATPase domain-containing protein [Deltaproteobacteria bacterium]
MNSKEDLRHIINRIDGRGYKAYKDIKGGYNFGLYSLIIDHVQGDPFAAPSRVRVRLPVERAGFPQDLWGKQVRRIAFCDYLTRQFHWAIRRWTKGHRGMGKSGLVDIDTGGQEILERNSVVVDGRDLEVRFVVGLPAAGRTILGREALGIFFEEIPQVVGGSLFYRSVDQKGIQRHADIAEDQEVMRDLLEEQGLVAFLAEESVLPRRSGVDDRPLEVGVIPLSAPFELQMQMELPHRGMIKGMGIPTGVTLIVGGGFHGKSTVLNAIERGIYNHIPDDGREYVVTSRAAVKIRAEDGRRIEKVNINPFISNLPFGKDTERFSTDNASGSTSQAANIMEALEVGAQVLLIDEDTSATNFMVRDERMQELVAKEKEPITPFVDKVRKLYADLGVSTILVMGGSGDYFDVADTVIMMDNYKPLSATQQAKEIAAKHASRRVDEGGDAFGEVTRRCPQSASFDPSRGKREVKIDTKGLRTILYGTTSIDLSCLEQLVDLSQTRAIGLMIHHYAEKYLHRSGSLKEGIELVIKDVEAKGLDCLLPYKVGNLAMPRIFEMAGAINRMRSLKVK